MKNVKKIFITIFIIIGLIVITSSSVYSATLDEISAKADNWKAVGQGQAYISETDAAENLLPIGQILVGFSVLVIIICAGVLAIKFLTGSPEQKGKLKQQAIGLAVAIIVIFGAVGIWALVRGIMEAQGF